MRHAMAPAIAGLLLAVSAIPAQQPGSFGSPFPAPQAQPVFTPSTPVLGPPPRPDPLPALSQAAPVVGPPPAPGDPAALGPNYVPSGAIQMPYGPGAPGPGGYTPLAFGGPVLPRDPTNPTIWGGVEALVWWSRSQPLAIPIVTTGPASQGVNAGNLGAPGTTSLTRPLHYGATGGMRVFAGAWIDTGHTFGIDGSLFFLGRDSARFGVADGSGNGSFVINEPIAGAPFSTQVAAPGTDTGRVSVNSHSRFAGGDVNLLFNLYRANGWTVNLLGGYRNLQLDESLDITGNSRMFVTTTYNDNAGNVLVSAPPGSTITVVDRFGTRNQFNGGQLGAGVQYAWDRWSINGTGKLAIGATHEMIAIDGNTTVFPAGAAPVPLAGGNFATLQTGRYAQNRFAVAPELTLNVGYQITPWMRATVGYNFLFLSSVARPGNQIDNSFDGVTHPVVPMASSAYWTQGLNLGLQFSF